MKKTVSMLLALALTASLAACGKGSTASSESPAETQGAVPEVTAAPVTETQSPVPSAQPVETAQPAPTPEATPETTPVPETPAPGGQTAADGVVALANSLLGYEFAEGGQGPSTFDNSGFVYYVCRENGLQVPRRSSEMADYGETVGWNDLRPGDICVMANEVGGAAGFVGIYVGGMQFIACNKPGDTVRLQNLDNQYWQDRFLSGRRGA